MLVPGSAAGAEITISRSKFLGSALLFDEPASLREILSSTRIKHPGCSHVVHAFLVGPDGARYGMSDDGEPHGTAGRPVYEILRGSGISNVLVLIVRYFGGIKLGTGGLVRAYGSVTRLLLDRLEVVPFVERRYFRLCVPYSLNDHVVRIILSLDGRVESTEYATEVTINASIPESERAGFDSAISDVSKGSICPDYSPDLSALSGT